METKHNNEEAIMETKQILHSMFAMAQSIKHLNRIVSMPEAEGAVRDEVNYSLGKVEDCFLYLIDFVKKNCPESSSEILSQAISQLRFEYEPEGYLCQRIVENIQKKGGAI